VTVTEYVPVVPVQDKVDESELPMVKLVGVRVQESPVDGDTLSDNVAVPE
jgi:hypothetical protein